MGTGGAWIAAWWWLVGPAVAGPALHVHNPCGQSVLLWLQYQRAGTWQVFGPSQLGAGSRVPLIDHHGPVVLEGTEFRYYVETVDGSSMWSGTHPVDAGARVLPMAARPVEPGPTQRFALDCDAASHRGRSRPDVPDPTPLVVLADCPRARRIDVWVYAAAAAGEEPRVRRLRLSGEGRVEIEVHGSPVGYHARARGRTRQVWRGGREVPFGGDVLGMADHDPERGPITLECEPPVGIDPLGIRVEEHPGGWRIVGVRRRGAGRAAGLRRGDVIATVDGAPVRSARALRSRLSKGRNHVLEVRDDGALRRVEVRLPRR